MPDGSIFSVPVGNVLIPSVEIGEVVTFSYERYGHKEYFVNPTVYQVRSDISWNDVVQNSKTEQHAPPTTGLQLHNSYNTQITDCPKAMYLQTHFATSHNMADPEQTTYRTKALHQSTLHYKNQMKPFNTKKNSQRRWTHQSMRLFLEDVARKHKHDESRPNALKNLSSASIRRAGGRTILEYFKGYSGAIKSLFPEIGLDTDRLELGSIVVRRNLLEKFAQSYGFDPKIPENWYQQPKGRLMAFEGIPSLMRFYKENIPKALISIFPDIGLDKSRFVGNLQLQRSFFEKYATENGFDSRNPDNWYQLSSNQIMSAKGALGALQNHSIIGVLCSAFPNIGLDFQSFRELQQQAKQREIFKHFAKQNSFDPYNPENWRNQSREKLLQIRGIHTVIKHHKNSLTSAIVHAFPGIGLENFKLQRLDRVQVHQ
eukprot:Phypoly_transcript_01431.p1 GENE.Phypoly_transcript_01431~~Phypoly_transcript_01431.p1  ORF type:complete len:429 (+),score=43.62 Phypoly_transcript_01431:2047-3333(+)